MLAGVSYRSMLEALCEQDSPAFPILSEIRRRLVAAARGIQAGIPEYVSDPRLPGIWLPPDDLSLTLLHVTGTLSGLLREAGKVLQAVVLAHGGPHGTSELSEGVLEDSIALSQLLMTGVGERMGGHENGLALRFNLWEVFLGQIEGRDVPLRSGQFGHWLTESSDFYRRVKMEEL